jgi:hypothetical protein
MLRLIIAYSTAPDRLLKGMQLVGNQYRLCYAVGRWRMTQFICTATAQARHWNHARDRLAPAPNMQKAFECCWTALIL